jgi:hypothetical protein
VRLGLVLIVVIVVLSLIITIAGMVGSVWLGL